MSENSKLTYQKRQFQPVSIQCKTCGTTFSRLAHEARVRKYCSRSCFYATRRKAIRDAKEAIRHAFELGFRALEDGTILSPDGMPVYQFPANTNGRYRSFKVPLVRSAVPSHRFIAYQIYGEEALHVEAVRHRNDVGHDNRFKNILIGSKSDNVKDIPLNKQMEYAQRRTRPLRKLTDEQAVELRVLVARGMSRAAAGRKFDISACRVSAIVSRKSYADVP